VTEAPEFLIMWQMFPNLIPIYMAWFSEFLAFTAIVTTMAFPNAPFGPSDHYQYYIFTFVGGEAVGRSYLMILSCIKAEWAESAKFPYLWVLSIIEVMHLLFFILAAWYRFLPNVSIVLLLSFTSGVSIGILYVNVLAFFRDTFDDCYQEFSMGYVPVAVNGGVLAAGFLGLYIEPLVREHCAMLVNNNDLCLTRSMTMDRFVSSCQ